MGVGFQPPFGAIGRSGRRYYFIPKESIDKFVEELSPAAQRDGIGGPAGGVGWVRFKGSGTNILNRFIELHQHQGSRGADLTELRQD
jgi:hypothetical protein